MFTPLAKGFNKAKQLQRPSSDIFEEDKQYPSVDPKQDLPVRGLPPFFVEMKKHNIHQKDALTNAYQNLQIEERTKMSTVKINISDLTSADRPDVKTKDDVIHVTEQVSAECIDNLRLHLNKDTYENILQMSTTPTWKKTDVHSNEFDYTLEYDMKCSFSLTEMAKSRHFGDPNGESNCKQYLEVILRMVQFVMDMNSQGWVLGSMRCLDMYCAKTYDGTRLPEYEIEQVTMARIGKMLWFDRTGLSDDYIIASQVASDSMRWCPIEVLQFQQYSFASDVYSLAMTIYEFYMTLSVNEKDPLAGEVECAPFPYVSIEDLQSVLYTDSKPARPAACPDWLYHELCKCWMKDEKSRPSCQLLYDTITTYLETGSVKEYSEIAGYESLPSDDDDKIDKNDYYDNVGVNNEYEIIPFDCVNSDSDSDTNVKMKSEQKRQKKKTRKLKEQLTNRSIDSEKDNADTTPKQLTTTAVFSLDV